MNAATRSTIVIGSAAAAGIATGGLKLDYSDERVRTRKTESVFRSTKLSEPPK